MPEIAGQVADGFADAVREHEEQWLSPLAVRSYESRGREHPEEECRLRTPFQRDRDRIVHSKAFRRLRHKTQVFIDPGGDHFRSRRIDTLVHDLVESSADAGDIVQSEQIGAAMLALRSFMFEHVYLGPHAAA